MPGTLTDVFADTDPNQLTRARLRALAEVTADAVLTAATVTDQATAEPQQNAVRLKGLRQQLERQLTERGVDAERIGALLAPFDQLLQEQEFWGHQRDGLVVCSWADGQAVFRTPFAVDDRAAVDVRPHLSPLLPALANEGVYYVLALSQQHVRLLRCRRTDVQRVDLGEAVPGSVADTITDDDGESPHLSHRPASRGGDVAVFHGHGGREHEWVQVEKFARAVARGVDAALAEERAPVVLAAVEELASELRGHTSLSTVLDDVVLGNPEERRDDELRDAAWPLVEPTLTAPVQEAVHRFPAHHGTGRALGGLPEVLQAAVTGRVETLLVAHGAQRWGHFDPAEGVTGEHGEPAGDDEELIERAVATTLAHGGDAYRLAPEEMPVDEPAAALCRW